MTVGDYLRRWRKARDMTQMDLAAEAYVSTRHLSFVENGRAHPSDTLLLKIAEVLDLPLRHTNALLMAAGYAPHYATPSPKEDVMVRAALGHIMRGHEPYPALVTDTSYTLIMANEGYYGLLRWLLGDTPPCDNVYRLMFTQLAPHIVDWQTVSGILLNRLREESLLYQNEALSDLYEECAATVSGAPPPEFTPPAPIVSITFAKGKRAACFFSTIATFGTAIDVSVRELRIENLFPGDRETKEFLRGGL